MEKEINKKWLIDHNACVTGFHWFDENYGDRTVGIRELALNLCQEKLYQWALWLVTIDLDEEQLRKYNLHLERCRKSNYSHIVIRMIRTTLDIIGATK